MKQELEWRRPVIDIQYWLSGKHPTSASIMAFYKQEVRFVDFVAWPHLLLFYCQYRFY